MSERRAEQRFMCSDLVTVELEKEGQVVVANLEDISTSGACLEMQHPVPAGTTMVLHCPGCRFRGKVRYCVLRQTGYQVGLELMECRWSKGQYEPKHLLEAPLVHAGVLASLIQDDAKSRRLLADVTAAPLPETKLRHPCLQTGGDSLTLSEPESPLLDRIRVVARAVASTCERLSPEDVKRCFSQWFQLSPDCPLCDEFLHTYQDEYAAVSSRPAPEKRRAAGGRFDDI